MMKGKSTNRCRCDYETFVGKLIEFFPYQRPHNADQGTKKNLHVERPFYTQEYS